MFYYILYIKQSKNNISIELTLKKLPYISPESNAENKGKALFIKRFFFYENESFLSMVFVQVKVAAKMTSLSQPCQWFLPFSRIAKFS